MDAVARAGPRPPGGGRSSSRSSSCRCTPGRSRVPAASATGTTFPGRCGIATSGPSDERSIRSSARTPRPGSDALGRPRPVGAALEVGARSSRRPGTGPSPRPASTAMFATASRSSIESASAPVADELERRVRRRRRRRSRRSPRGSRPCRLTKRALLAGELDADRRRHRLPELAEGEAGRDVGRAEAASRTRRARRSVHVCESPPATTGRGRSSPPRRAACARSRRAPGRRTSRPAPRDHSFSRRCSSAERASFAGMKWSATITTFAGSKTSATPIFSICRNATGPLTSFAITTSQRTITTSPGLTSSASQWASRIFSASVCGSERPPGARPPRRPRRRRRTSCRCRRGSPRARPGCGRRPPRAARPAGSRAGARRPRSPGRSRRSRRR